VQERINSPINSANPSALTVGNEGTEAVQDPSLIPACTITKFCPPRNKVADRRAVPGLAAKAYVTIPGPELFAAELTVAHESEDPATQGHPP